MSAVAGTMQSWKAECRIGDLTEEQINILCEEGKEPKFRWLSRKEAATADREALAQYGMDYEQLTERLINIIHQAGKHHADSVPLGYLLIEGLSSHMKMMDECVICPYKLGPRQITITNISNNESVRFIETTLHMLKRHHYLGREGTDWRLDPERICKILS